MLAPHDASRFNGVPMGRRRRQPQGPVAIAVRKIGPPLVSKAGDVTEVARLIGISRTALHTYMNAGYFTPCTPLAKGTQYWTVRRLAAFSGVPDWMLLGYLTEQEFECAMNEPDPEKASIVGQRERS